MRKNRNPAFHATVGMTLLACAGSLFGQTVGSGSEGAPAASPGPGGDFQVFGGLRLWHNNFDVPTPTEIVTGSGGRLIEDRYKDTRSVPIPFVGVRYGRFIASTSYFPPTTYRSDRTPDSVRRDEFDLNVGYYVLPQLAVSLGYKVANLDIRSPTTGEGKAKLDALLLGVSGSTPLEPGSRLSIYGNLAYGRGKDKIESSSSLLKLDLTYRIGEVGLSYRLFTRPVGFIRQASLSLGYRAQIVTLKEFPFPELNSSGVVTRVERRNVQSTTDGVVVGLVGTF